jgi:hypothetical protein
LLHWLFGRPTSTKEYDELLLGLGVLYLVREFLGYKGSLIELRFRTLETSERLAAIEKTLSNRGDVE